MVDTNIEKLKILQDELISSQELDKMKEINQLVEELYKGKIKYDDVLPKICNLPQYTISDKENIASTYRESLCKLVLYATFINRFELLENKEVVKIVNEVLRDEVDQFPVYNNDIPSGLKDAITNTRCNAIRNGYIDYNLMQQLFAYKYGKNFKDSTEAITTGVAAKDYEISEVNTIKKEIKKMCAKIAFWAVISIPVYLAPLFGITKLTKHIATKKEYAAEIITEDGEARRADYWDLYFSSSLPTDYKKQKLQYITEFGETVDNKVCIKVYNYTGLEVNEETIDNIELDIDRLVYCNYFEASSNTPLWLNGYLGTYTGEAHRNFATIEKHLYVTEDKVSFWGFTILFSVITYLIFGGILGALHSSDIHVLLDGVFNLVRQRARMVQTKEEAEREIEKLKKEVDKYVESTFINYKSNHLDEYNEKYGDSESEFQKRLRRK